MNFEKENNPSLQKQQINWLHSLCYKSAEEILEIAEWYLADENPYQNPLIAYKLFIYLHVAHHYNSAWDRAEYVWQKFWPDEDGLSYSN